MYTSMQLKNPQNVFQRQEIPVSVDLGFELL